MKDRFILLLDALTAQTRASSHMQQMLIDNNIVKDIRLSQLLIDAAKKSAAAVEPEPEPECICSTISVASATVDCPFCDATVDCPEDPRVSSVICSECQGVFTVSEDANISFG